jgi:hypothetical protein
LQVSIVAQPGMVTSHVWAPLQVAFAVRVPQGVGTSKGQGTSLSDGSQKSPWAGREAGHSMQVPAHTQGSPTQQFASWNSIVHPLDAHTAVDVTASQSSSRNGHRTPTASQDEPSAGISVGHTSQGAPLAQPGFVSTSGEHAAAASERSASQPRLVSDLEVIIEAFPGAGWRRAGAFPPSDAAFCKHGAAA